MKHVAGLLLVVAGSLLGQTGRYPTGTDVPLNTKILAAGLPGATPTLVLRQGTVPVEGQMELTPGINGPWLVFSPARPLTPRTLYTATLDHPGIGPTTWTFTTGTGIDTTAPAVISTTPANGADVSFASPSVTIEFSKPMNPVSVKNADPVVIDLATGSLASALTWLMAPATTLRTEPFTPAFGSVYRVYFRNGLPQDLAGNPVAAPLPDFTFATYPNAPKGGPAVTATIPGQDEQEVPTNAALFLLFDRPVPVPTQGTLKLASDSDPDVRIQVEAVGGLNALVVRPQLLLRPNQEYTLRASRLYDSYGGQIADRAVLKFRTATLPETRPLQSITAPQSRMPNVRRLQWRFNRALNPHLLPRLAYLSGPGDAATIPLSDVQLLADGTTIEAAIPAPGRYHLVGDVYGRADYRAVRAGDSWEITVESAPDDQPPRVLALFPSHPTTAATPTAEPGVLFDETIERFADGQVSLWRGSDRIPADVSILSASRVTIRPRQPLAPGEYRVAIASPRDIAGNAAEPLEWTFRVEDAPPPSDPFRLEQVEPQDNALDIDPGSPLVFTFNRPLNPLSLLALQIPRITTGPFSIQGHWRFEGNQAIFQPAAPLPSGARISWSMSAVRDFNGLAAGTSTGGFWVAGKASTEAFLVSSVSPGAHETGTSGDAAITLQFNQPADPATISDRNIALLANGRYLPIRFAYDAARNRTSISTDWIQGTFHLIAGSGIRSQSGTQLEAFSAEIQLAEPRTASGIPHQRQIGPFLRSPATNQDWLLPDSPIILFFTQPMERSLVEQGLKVVVGNRPIAGRIEWSPDSRALTFYASGPMAANSSGTVYLSRIPWSGTGVEAFHFQVRQNETTTSRWSFARISSHVPADSIFDVEFDRDRPAGFVQSAVARSVSDVPLEVTALSPRTFRFRPTRPLEVGPSWHINLKTPEGDLLSPFFQVADWKTPESRQIDVGPTIAMGDVPLNGLIWLQSRTPLNAISLRCRLVANGVAVPVTTEFLDLGFLVLIRPTELLQGSSVYSVELSGLEDLAGRRMPDRAWTFRTGTEPSFEPMKLVSWTPQGVAPISSVLRATFSQPVVFVRGFQHRPHVAPNDFAIATPSAIVKGRIQYSDDGRTLSYIPERSWPAGTTVRESLDQSTYLDWTGAFIVNLSSPPSRLEFTTSIETAPAVPATEAVNPQPGADNVPRNVQIQARFAQPVLQSSLAQIRLESDGSVVPTRVLIDADGRTVTLLPGTLLEGARTYSVIVEGVRNGDGVPMPGAETWTFRTSGLVEVGSTIAAVTHHFTEGCAFRVHSLRPLNFLSVLSSAFELRVNGILVASNARVENQGRSAVVSAAQSITEESQCELSRISLRDWAGNAVALPSPFTARFEPATATPPSVRLILPAPGATVAWTSVISVAFDRVIVLPYGDAHVRVRSAGLDVPVAVQRHQTGTSVRISALRGWLPGATYDVEVTGILDQDGNEAAPINWSFQIERDPVADTTPPALVRTDPENDAVGVPPEKRIEFEFSEPVSFEGAFLTASRLGQTNNLDVLIRPSYQNNRIVLNEGRLPGGTEIAAQMTVADQSERRNSALLRFATAAELDTSPPVLESIWPSPGTVLNPGKVEVILRFSEPVVVTDSPALFSFSGQQSGPQEFTFPAQGDGRILRVRFWLPPDVSATLNVLDRIVDLSGNRFTPASFGYRTGSNEDLGLMNLVSVSPGQSSSAPPDAVIQLRFSQVVSEAVLRASLRVWNAGDLIPVTTASEDGKAWRITPLTPWRENTTVAVEVLGTLYGGPKGSLLGSTASWVFYVTSGAINNTEANAVSAIDVSATSVDIRFAEPRSLLPAQPFGIRSGQQRIPAYVERLGEAWFRLVPDVPLTAGASYHLMAGPGVEFPLQVPKQAQTFEAVAQPSEILRRDAEGRIHIRIGGEVHRFSIGPSTLAVFDRNGLPVPYQASFAGDGRTLVLEPFGAPAHRIVLQGRTLNLP